MPEKPKDHWYPGAGVGVPYPDPLYIRVTQQVPESNCQFRRADKQTIGKRLVL